MRTSDVSHEFVNALKHGLLINHSRSGIECHLSNGPLLLDKATSTCLVPGSVHIDEIMRYDGLSCMQRVKLKYNQKDLDACYCLIKIKFTANLLRIHAAKHDLDKKSIYELKLTVF